MPRKRLPWFKVWVGATRHEKVAMLDDRTFRAWVELLDAASQQTVRGQFASTAAAASVIRRPLALVKILIQAHLLDQTADGVIQMHDWPDWQRWRPEDSPSDPDPPPESHTNNSGITPESHTNPNGITHDKPAIDTRKPSRGAERAKTEKKKGEEDVDVRRKTRDVTPSATTSLSPKGAAAAAFSDEERLRINAVAEALAHFGISEDPQLWRKVLDTYGVLDLEAEAIKQADWMHRHHIRACTSARYLNWLSKARADGLPMLEPEDIPSLPPQSARKWQTCSRCSRQGNFPITERPMCSGCEDIVAGKGVAA